MTEIIPFAHIEHFAQEWHHKEGGSIVFTNGCFDVLHRGHVQYLEAAKKLGVLLLVGINSDRSVQRLKGEGRPLINQEDRAYLLSRLKPVDVVCIFDEDTPEELIRRVKPDILVKGGDYALDEIVGRDLVESYGGLVRTIPYVKGYSTTAFIGRIKKQGSL